MSKPVAFVANPVRAPRRLAVLTEGLDQYRNKTAVNLIRFRPQEVVCVIDTRHAGQDLQQLLGIGKGIPIVGSAAEAVKLGAAQLVIGVATPGGFLPAELRPIVYEAMRNRVGVISGLHESVAGDPNLASLAARHAVEIVNLRRLSDDAQHIGKGLARQGAAFRVLTVGTDANIGKTTTTLLMHEWHKKNGPGRSRFVATGPDGVLVKGRGMCIDRCITDFASGAMEDVVLRESKGRDMLFIEGQDSILSPCYSAVCAAVLHGSCPDAMVLCHIPTRRTHRHTDVPIPPLSQYIAAYEMLLSPMHPGKVVAISLNTMDLDPDSARKAIERACAETGLPVADPVREGDAGVARLVGAVVRVAIKSGHPLSKLVKKSPPVKAVAPKSTGKPVKRAAKR
jgi:uncharacterized NAD-dependent epimerase/dehydratase family protein